MVGNGFEEGGLSEGRENFEKLISGKTETNLKTWKEQKPVPWSYHCPKMPLHTKCLVEDDYTC